MQTVPRVVSREWRTNRAVREGLGETKKFTVGTTTFILPAAPEAAHFVDDDNLEVDALPVDFDPAAALVCLVVAPLATLIMDGHWREIVCYRRSWDDPFKWNWPHAGWFARTRDLHWVPSGEPKPLGFDDLVALRNKLKEWSGTSPQPMMMMILTAGLPITL